jgi:uncharacterized RDD family membrane protein YckC
MAAITVLNKGNVPVGPFTRAQVAEKLQSGEFTVNDLAFVEGLSEWTPLRDVLARVDATAMNLPPPAPTPQVLVPAGRQPAYSYAATMQPPSHLTYGGFWARVAAYLLDGLILSIPLILICVVLGMFVGGFAVATGVANSPHRLSSDSPGNIAFPLAIVLVELIFFVVFIIGAWLYFAMLESGPQQATYGKRIMGLKVTDMTGERITFGRASGRYFSKIITNMIPLFMGYIMMVFMDQKQALHDLIASTLVVKS